MRMTSDCTEENFCKEFKHLIQVFMKILRKSLLCSIQTEAHNPLLHVLFKAGCPHVTKSVATIPSDAH